MGVMTSSLLKNFPFIALLLADRSVAGEVAVWHEPVFEAMRVKHMIAASRFLAGGTMAGDFYEPNPPMSISGFTSSLYLWRAIFRFLPGMRLISSPTLICLTASTLAVVRSTLPKCAGRAR